MQKAKKKHNYNEKNFILKNISVMFLFLPKLLNFDKLQEIIKEREEEREKLRKELRRSRERIHALDTDVQRREFSEMMTTTTHTQTMLG